MAEPEGLQEPNCRSLVDDGRKYDEDTPPTTNGLAMFP